MMFDKEGRKKLYTNLFSDFDKAQGGSGYVTEDMFDHIDWLANHMEHEYDSWRRYGIINDEGHETKRWYLEGTHDDYEDGVREQVNREMVWGRKFIIVPSKQFYDSLPDPPNDYEIWGHQQMWEDHKKGITNPIIIYEPEKYETLVQRILNIGEVTYKQWIRYDIENDLFMVLSDKELKGE